MLDEGFVDSLDFRKARLSDARKVDHLVRELAGDVSPTEAKKRFRRLVIRPSYLIYLFLFGGRPIALFIAREGYFLSAANPYLHVLGVVIDPKYQRQGLGSALSQQYLMKMYPEADYSQLWLVTQQDHLHDFYKSVGFDETGTRFVMHVQGQGKPSIGRRIARTLGI